MFPSGLKELVRWITFLLPGWFAIVITGVITDYGPSGELSVVFSSFLLSVLSYAVARSVFRLVRPGAPKATMRAADGPVVEKDVDIKNPPEWSLFAVAGVFGLLLGLGIQNNLLYSGLRLLPFGLGGVKVGEGRPRISVLKDATFNELSYWRGGKLIEPARNPDDGGNAQNYYLVKGIDGAPTYEGLVLRFETGEQETDLYLNPACLVIGTEVTLLPGPGVVIYERGIASIEIRDRNFSECYKQTLVPSPSVSDGQQP